MTFHMMNKALCIVLSLAVLLGPLNAAASEITFVHPDHLGSPVAYTNINANLVGQEFYTPYGETLNGSSDDDISFTGHYKDADTGLVYAQARYYDPVVGRFLSVDPVTFSPDKPQQFNRYWYAAGNPYMYTDPDGRHIVTKIIKFIANGGDAAATFGGMVDDVKTLASPTASGGQKALAAVSLASEVFSPVSLKEGKAIVEGVEGALRHGDNAGDTARGAPDFVVSSGGTAYPVPSGATGPVPVINPAGNQTGVKFSGGTGGANGQVDTMRIMDPTPARGNAPSYQNGYIKYENATRQGVDPYSGKTVSRADAHHSIE